jgi:hypothetical protein
MGSRTGLLRRSACATVAVLILCGLASGALAAGRALVLTGTWSCCGAGGAAAQVWVLSEVGGRITGKGEIPSGGVFASITGTVHGRKVTMVDTYNSFAPGYIAHFSGTVASSWRRASGVWSSNRDQSGTWTATLVPGKGKKRKA